MIQSDIPTWTWGLPAVTGDAPSGRKFHAACPVLDKYVAISGGEGAGSELDMKLLEPQSVSVAEWVNKEVTGTAPQGRMKHGMTAAGGRIFVFGGEKVEDIRISREMWVEKFGSEEGFDLYDTDGDGIIDAEEW